MRGPSGEYHSNPIERRLLRVVARLQGLTRSRSSSPPVLCNSVPKAGTHLLSKGSAAFAEFDRQRHYSDMRSSLQYRRRPDGDRLKFVRSLQQGEHARAHMGFDTQASISLAEREVLHFLVVRDPLAIARSESVYLRTGNRFHRLHRVYFWSATAESAFRAVVAGIDGILEPLDQRVARYRGWLTDPNCITIRYEDLIHLKSRATLIDELLDRSSRFPNLELPTREALTRRWTPGSSHTVSASKYRGSVQPDIEPIIQRSRLHLGYGEL